MTKPLRIVQRLICLSMLLSMPACATTYRGAAIEGLVVDAETREPIKNVVVVAEWKLYGGWIHPDILGRLLLQETVTDAQGHYRFPAWGPLRAAEGEIDRMAPALSFYKRGYKFTARENQRYVAHYVALPDPLISEWDGKTIELAPYESKFRKEDYIQEAIGASSLFSFVYDKEPCAWQKMPRMTAQLLMLDEEYRRNGSSANMPSISRLHSGGKCADPRTLLRSDFQ